jgi:exosortase family protein XrtM
MLALYALLYFPYPADSLPVRVLARYLDSIAQVSAALIRLVDPQVFAQGPMIMGRFPLRIVLDCAGLEVHALYSAAVCAFPAPWRAKWLGLCCGFLVLASLNLARIAALYFAGVHAPRWFDFLHEEVMAIFLVVCACLVFAGWTRLATGLNPERLP